MWNVFKQTLSDLSHPSRWKTLPPLQKFDVLMMYVSVLGIIFTGFIVYFAYVETFIQVREESFEKTQYTSRYNIVESYKVAKHITIFTIRDSETQTDYIIYDHSNGMFDNQAILMETKKK